MIDNFNLAIETILKHEGYYSNDPDDKGGETKYGISKRSYPELDIKSLTLEQAKEIYKKDFWDNINLDEIKDFEVAKELLEDAVNVGCIWAVKFLQRAIRSVTDNKIILIEDGIMGHKTIYNANNCNAKELAAALKSEAAGYYRNNKINPKFKEGLLNRAYL